MNIPQEWLSILAAVQQHAPGAILAGGALRDLDNERPVKDLDIFVPYGTSIHNIDFALMGLFDGVEMIMDIADGYADTSQFDVSQIVEWKIPGLPNVNVIACKEGVIPANDPDRYDFGICQIWHDGEKLYTTAAYEYDKAWKLFTLIRADSPKGVERSMRRYARLKQKYDWPVFTPNGTTVCAS